MTQLKYKSEMTLDQLYEACRQHDALAFQSSTRWFVNPDVDVITQSCRTFNFRPAKNGMFDKFDVMQCLEET